MLPAARTWLVLVLLLSCAGCGKKGQTSQNDNEGPPASKNGTPAATPQDEAKAREITLAFLKGMREKNVDGMQKATTLPFLVAGERGSLTALQTRAEVRAWLQTEADAITDPKKVASEVVRVEPLPPTKKADNPKEQEFLDLAVKTAGGSGYFMLVGKGKSDDFMVLVARKNGQVLIMGVVP